MEEQVAENYGNIYKDFPERESQIMVNERYLNWKKIESERILID